MQVVFWPIMVKFMYSEKATKFCEISTVDLTGMHYTGQTYGGETKENYFSGIKNYSFELRLFNRSVGVIVNVYFLRVWVLKSKVFGQESTAVK